MTVALPRLFLDREPVLSHAQKALVEWAKVDDNQAILDTSCSNGVLLNYLMNRYTVRACGIAPGSTEEVAARDLLCERAEVYRASLQDIPWRDDTFHTAFVTGVDRSPSLTRLFLLEVLRVLKPQGHVLVSMPCVIPLRRLVAASPWRPRAAYTHAPFALMGMLEKAGFTDVSMRGFGLRTAVIIAQKGRAAGVHAQS